MQSASTAGTQDEEVAIGLFLACTNSTMYLEICLSFLEYQALLYGGLSACNSIVRQLQHCCNPKSIIGQQPATRKL